MLIEEIQTRYVAPAYARLSLDIKRKSYLSISISLC